MIFANHLSPRADLSGLEKSLQRTQIPVIEPRPDRSKRANRIQAAQPFPAYSPRNSPPPNMRTAR